MEPHSRSDDDLLAAYVTDELDEGDRVHLELRLTAEPALAERLLALEAIDLVGTTLQAAIATRPKAPRRVWIAVAAAAAAAAIVAGGWLWSRDSRAIPCRVAAIASLGADDLGAYAERLGVPPERRFVAAMRSGTTPTSPVSVAQFLDEVTHREDQRAELAMQSPATPLGEACFTLRIDVERTCHALVLQLDGTGRWTRVFPSPTPTPLFAETRNPLAPGRHTLPRPVVMPNALGTLSLHPGFEVAGEGPTPTASIVVALREQALDATTESALAERLRIDATGSANPADGKEQAASATQRAQSMSRWLADLGFTTRQLEVAVH